MPKTVVGDVELSYAAEGKGRCIVLLHGIGGTLHDFSPIASKLAKGYRVLRLDQRGFGKSDKPVDRPYSTGLWAEDLHQLLFELRIRRAIVAGHSMGGRIACHFAAKYPQQTSALITLNTTAWGSSPTGAKQLRAVVSRIHAEGMTPVLRRAAWLQGLRRTHPRTAALIRETTLANDPAAYGLALQAVAADFAGETDSSFLGKITCPTLIVVGDRDSAPLQGALEMHRRIQNSHFGVIPDCGHYSIYEKPRIVLSMIDGFLSALQ